MDLGIGEGSGHDNRRMSARIAAFAAWAALAASVVFWALRLWSTPIATPPHATVVAVAGAMQGDRARVLGSDAAPAAPGAALPVAPADARFKLLGVVAPRAPGSGVAGVALIATDGNPAKAYRVGAAVDGELVLQSVRSRAASLGPRGQPAQLELQLPALAAPSGGAPGAAPRPAMPPVAPRAATPLAAPPPVPPGAEDDDAEPPPMPRVPASPDRSPT